MLDLALDGNITLEEMFARTNPEPEELIGYIRMSSLREKRKGTEISTEIQKSGIEGWAARQHPPKRIVDWVYDLNISGRRDMFLKRKILPTIQRVKDGEAQGVAVYNVSRWGRSTRESTMSEVMLWDVGGRLMSATEPNDDRSAVGKFSRTTLFALAEMQSDMIGEGWRAVHKIRLQNKLPRDGRPRFGYNYSRDGRAAVYAVDPATGPLLAQAYRDTLAGKSLWATTVDYINKGVKSPGTDKPITYLILQNALDSGFGAGKIVTDTRAPEKGKPANRRYLPGAQEPVITPKEWTDYLALRRAARPHDADGNPLLMAGGPQQPTIHALHLLVFCGGCKRTMGRDGNRLLCRGRSRSVNRGTEPCPAPTGVRIHLVEGAVKEWLRLHAGETPESATANVERAQRSRQIVADVAVLKTDLAGKQAYVTNLSRQLASERIDEATFDELKAEAAVEIKRLHAAIAAADTEIAVLALPSSDVFGAVLAGWEEYGMDAPLLNNGLKKVLRGVYVGKGHTASSPEKFDIIGRWERRQPKVFLGAVRGVDHERGKHCSKCLVWKEAAGFYVRGTGRDKGALSSWCRECQRAYLRDKREADEKAGKKRDRTGERRSQVTA